MESVAIRDVIVELLLLDDVVLPAYNVHSRSPIEVVGQREGSEDTDCERQGLHFQGGIIRYMWLYSKDET